MWRAGSQRTEDETEAMKYEEKRDKIRKLKEDELRPLLLIPLLQAMGFHRVYEYCGGNEKGKDIIFHDTNKLDEDITYAAVVSRANINAQVGDSRSALRVYDQATMALREPFTDMYTGRPGVVDRCWIITSGAIKTTAVESIAGRLKDSGLGRVTSFIDIQQLVKLVDEYYPEFWHRPPHHVYLFPLKYVDISANELDPPYNMDVDDLSNLGSLKEGMHLLKNLIHSLLGDIEDIHDKLAQLLVSNHPWDVVSGLEWLCDQQFGSGRVYVPTDLSEIHSLWQHFAADLKEYEEGQQVDPDERKGHGPNGKWDWHM